MIEHVYRRVAAVRGLRAVVVATDDEAVAQAVTAFGGTVRMTSPAHRSGTDRVAEVAADLDCDVVVNVQGDEPLLEPAMIEELVEPFTSDTTLEMATLRRRIETADDLSRPHVVKVVVDRHGHALYFSRAAIPYRHGASDEAAAWHKHIGIYAFRRPFLLRFAQWPSTPLERIEGLEQLRALEHGVRILVVDTRHDSIGVDTPDELERVRQLMAADVGA